jgi:hypothetical protein
VVGGDDELPLSSNYLEGVVRRHIKLLDEFSAVTEPRQPLLSHPGHVAAGGELIQW